MGYCRRFIPRYKALTNLINAMNKYLKFEWSEDIEKDFMELKEEFDTCKIQVYPDFDSNEPFILTADWFALNIAGILSGSATNKRNIIHPEKKTGSFSEEHREMETYPEVLAPFSSLYSHIQPEVHCQHKI